LPPLKIIFNICQQPKAEKFGGCSIYEISLLLM